MRGTALRAAGMIGLLLSVARCGFDSEVLLGDGDYSPEPRPGLNDGPTRAGGNIDQAESGGSTSGPAGVGGGAGSGEGGAGGDFNDPGMGGGGGNPAASIPPDCAEKASQRVVAAMSIEDPDAFAAPAYVRDILKSENGDTPSANLLKPHEFFNYYAVPYAPAGSGSVGITAGLWKMAPDSPDSGEYRLTVGVTAPLAPNRPRANIAIVVDTSISMTNTGITRARAIVKAIGKSLKEGDVVSLVTWNPDVPPLLDGLVVGGPDDPAFATAAGGLYADGGSDIQAGLLRGYELADKTFDKDGLNRLVFISDGRVTLGSSEQNVVRDHARDLLKKITLVGAATGPAAGYDETFMATLAEAGLGSYVYVDSEAEATRLFHDRFGEVMGEPIYDGVTLTLNVPAYFELVDFVEPAESEQYSSELSGIAGRPLAPGDAMTFNQILKACHSQVISDEHTVTAIVTWIDRATGAPGSASVELKMVELFNNSVHPGIRKANAISFFADALRSGGGFGDPVALGDAWARINTINDFFKEAGKPGDSELEEILALLKRHPKYPPPAQP